jgi:hypothetical protein
LVDLQFFCLLENIHTLLRKRVYCSLVRDIVSTRIYNSHYLHHVYALAWLETLSRKYLSTDFPFYKNQTRVLPPFSRWERHKHPPDTKSNWKTKARWFLLNVEACQPNYTASHPSSTPQ